VHLGGKINKTKYPFLEFLNLLKVEINYFGQQRFEHTLNLPIAERYWRKMWIYFSSSEWDVPLWCRLK